MTTEEKELDSRARNAARKVGLKAVKSRKRHTNFDNYGGYMLVNTDNNSIEAGQKFDLSAEDVIRVCSE